jgi:hypothetical protein
MTCRIACGFEFGAIMPHGTYSGKA